MKSSQVIYSGGRVAGGEVPRDLEARLSALVAAGVHYVTNESLVKHLGLDDGVGTRVCLGVALSKLGHHAHLVKHRRKVLRIWKIDASSPDFVIDEAKNTLDRYPVLPPCYPAQPI